MASTVLIRLSRTGTVRTFTAGENGDFPTGGLDYTGDGVADMLTQRNAGGGTARFQIFDGVTGAAGANFILGTPTDIIVTGNHAGDIRADVTVTRGMAGVRQHTTRDGSTGITAAAVPFGASATDFPLSGDFDGDGIYDYAMFRPSATPGMTKFLVRPSLAPATTLEVPAGQNGDYPPANGRVN